MILNANSIVQHVIRIKNGIIKYVNVNVNVNMNVSWNPSTCICENSKYSKCVANTSVTECEEIIIAMDNLSTNKKNTVPINVTSTVSKNRHSKKVGDFYILHKILLVIILLFIITVICYHYAKQKGIIYGKY